MARAIAWISWLVPAASRAEWQREWLAEFEWAARHGGAARSPQWRRGRLWAAVRHALWLRWESWQLTALGQDLRYAGRALRRRPGFAASAVLTLALGVAATTVVFSTVRAVVWRPLPYPNPAELVLVGVADIASDTEIAETVSPPDFVDYRTRAQAFRGMAAYTDQGLALTGDGLAQQVSGETVTGDFFSVLGVPAALGRTFAAADLATGAPDVVILSDRFWRSRFGADRAALGRRVTLDGTSREIIGVMPATFEDQARTEVWIPLQFTPDDLATQRGAHYLSVIGRLGPQIRLGQASAEMAAIGRQLAAAYPKTNADGIVTVVPLRLAIIGDVEPAMRVLLGAVALVFLVACVNVASLVMGAGLERTRDLAVQAALGASRGRMVRGLFLESVLVDAAGSLAGLALAVLGVQVVATVRVGIPLLDETTIDAAAALFAAGLMGLSAVIFGVAPAVLVAGGHRQPLAGSGVRSTTSRQTRRTREFLVMGEVAMAVALLVGAGLLARSFLALTRVPLGIEPGDVQTATVGLPSVGYRDLNRRVVFVDTVLARLRAQGEIQTAGAIFGVPLTPFSYNFSLMTVDGVRPAPGAPLAKAIVELRVVTPGLFEALGMARVAGRDFADTDRRGTPPVALVNRRAAQLLWPHADPIGHSLTLGTRLGLGGAQAGGEVIGVLADIQDAGPAARPRATIYLSELQFPMDAFTFVVKPRGRPTDLLGVIRGAVAEADPDVPVFGARTMAEVVSRVVAQPRFYLVLVGLFAGAALVLAAVGVYGVMAQMVGARRREIGIRLALGGTPQAAVRLMLRRAVLLASVGLLVGGAAAVESRSVLGRLLFGIRPLDGPTFLAVGITTLLAAGLAAWLPARRAARIDPITTLRAE